MALTILIIHEPSDSKMITSYLIDTDLNDEELQELAYKIRDEFEEQGHEEWTYGEILEELENRGHLKVLEHNELEIYL